MGLFSRKKTEEPAQEPKDLLHVEQLTDKMAYAASIIYTEAWKDNYRSVLPLHFLSTISFAYFMDRLGDPWEDPYKEDLLLYEEDRTLGGMSVRHSTEEERPEDCEMTGIYVKPVFQRRGYGKRLLSDGLDVVKGRGYRKVFVWVMEKNTGGRAFLESQGFTDTGDMKSEVIGGEEIPMVRYEKNI